MKEKTIEKIPFLRLPEVVGKKKVRYVGVTAIKNVAHERHFFLEVYRNSEEGREVPLVRIAITKKDFGTWIPETGVWTRQRCTAGSWKPIWYQYADSGRTGTRYEKLTEENVLFSQKDGERMKNYFSEVRIWDKNRWWEYIEQKQTDIDAHERIRREHRRNERRRQALDERAGATPELQEEAILAYADREIFRNRHCLYYKKTGGRARIACSACGGISEGRWKAWDSYESQFGCQIAEPRRGICGKCPNCGASGEYVAQGRMRSPDTRKVNVFLGQRYRETGMVFRYIKVEKRYEIDFVSGEKGPEMTGAREVLECVESARAYFEEGKAVQTDYHKYNPYSGKTFWDDCNLSGNACIAVRAGWILPETWTSMAGTILQYSALREYHEAAGEINAFEYLERYLQTPQIEILVKQNLIRVVDELVRCHYGIVHNVDAIRVHEFLGIRKERIRMLAAEQGDLELLRVMQKEKRLGGNWTQEQIRALMEIGGGSEDITAALQYMTIQKLLNRISKYAQCEYGTGCSHAEERLRQTAYMYIDYLNMRKQLGYDLTDSVYQVPRNLTEAHNKMMEEINKEKQEERIKKAEMKYPGIRKNYRTLRKIYFYEDENYLIRPARSAEEIITEGRILHHCVGGDNYLGKHEEGKTYILMLRFRSGPDMPYITVEISGKGQNPRIIQWHGKNNRQPDQKNMQKWLDKYVTRLRCMKDGMLSEAAGSAAEEAAMPLIAAMA